MKKRLIAAGLMLAMFTGTAAAVSSYTKAINVEYGVSLSINGKTPTLTDVNGKAVQPFVYDGTTYVPIRAVGENLGATVGYDEASNAATVRSANVEALRKNFEIAKLSHRAYEISLTMTWYITSNADADLAASIMPEYEAILAQAQTIDLTTIKGDEMMNAVKTYLQSQIDCLSQSVTAFYNFYGGQSAEKLTFLQRAQEQVSLYQQTQDACSANNLAY